MSGSFIKQMLSLLLIVVFTHVAPPVTGAPLGARCALPDRRPEQLHKPYYLRGLLLHREEEEAKQD